MHSHLPQLAGRRARETRPTLRYAKRRLATWCGLLCLLTTPAVPAAEMSRWDAATVGLTRSVNSSEGIAPPAFESESVWRWIAIPEGYVYDDASVSTLEGLNTAGYKYDSQCSSPPFRRIADGTRAEWEDPPSRPNAELFAAKGGPKAGSAEPAGAGKRFPESVKEQARTESAGKCVFCDTKTGNTPGPKRSEIDHAIPKSRGGDNSPGNAQNTCRDCNRSKGAKTTEEFLNGK